MVTSQFKRIGIMGRVKSPGINETLTTLIEYLSHLQLDFILDEELATLFTDLSYPYCPRSQISKACDLVIVIGGDGSLLQAVHTVIHDEIPVLGINRGRLGFLTDIHPTDLDKIKIILGGNFIQEKRFLLTAAVYDQSQKIGECDALNEVALLPDANPHMYEFEIYINEQFVCSQDSDGVIIATPTGSTAYALSGGGPILHPKLDAMVIVPMFPHTLSLRPLVIEGNHAVKIIITPNNTAAPRLSCDGQAFITTPVGSHIIVEKKTKALHLIHPPDYDYYETLRTKLHWGRKLNYL